MAGSLRPEVRTVRTQVRTLTVGKPCACPSRIALSEGRTPSLGGTPCNLRCYPDGISNTTPKPPDLLHRSAIAKWTNAGNPGLLREALPYVAFCFGRLANLTTRSRSASK
ncbi:hypothetical protein CJO81_01445 [Ralstonia solanacearum]|nr:hypothetical protein CJO81_01445 [Ralstonia solanacearum]AXW09183.1 hypothetical protein CJO83_01075 [Ralstonia solanacearum]AXW27040.1 hypothetical protein CJO87_01440 [Ralstonia solanacearum]AXW41794.1 hypothetical protein CJO90_01070 [Ralstonia solanacearum]AXW46481.1 hypothetical protein CJO91_01335 [Ralstonia solanacearum]